MLERALALVSEELDHPLNALLTEYEQELFRLADQAGLLADPEAATRRMATILASRGIDA